MAAANRAAWAGGDFVRAYTGRELRPVEVLLLVRLRESLSGSVLELGCGAGRISGYLVALAHEFHGMDISPRMVAASQRSYPAGDFAQGDVDDVARFADDSVDAVIAGWNLLDVLDDAERREALRAIRRALAPGGVLIMSSHNLAYLPRLRSPAHVRLGGLRQGRPQGVLQFAADVVRAPRRVRRHRRLRVLERRTADYALVSDGSHEFTLVHYYIDPAAQFRQFREVGLEPESAADLDGRSIDRGDEAPDCPEIHYVARKPVG
ncbi:MAG TPA: class I SAM-dependent methyltransferase [Solirubrobacteraceae bacterium]